MADQPPRDDYGGGDGYTPPDPDSLPTLGDHITWLQKSRHELDEANARVRDALARHDTDLLRRSCNRAASAYREQRVVIEEAFAAGVSQRDIERLVGGGRHVVIFGPWVVGHMTPGARPRDRSKPASTTAQEDAFHERLQKLQRRVNGRRAA